MKMEHIALLRPDELLLYWVRERESIRRKRALGVAPPWTEDEILSTYRFCNVRRMDDKVSQWLLKNWYKPNKDHPNIVVAATLARQLNNIDSLEAIGFPTKWNPSRYGKLLNERASKGLKNFSAAYMVTGSLGGTKVHQVISKVVNDIYEVPPAIDNKSMEFSVKALLPCRGFSTFMAGQVVADLRWAMSGSWKDRWDWAPIGPGSRRGMNRLHRRPIATQIDDKQFLEELGEVIQMYSDRLNIDISKRLEAQDVQSTLCEYDKYCRALYGEGRPKQLYRGGN